jgi:hypothetical protein
MKRTILLSLVVFLFSNIAFGQDLIDEDASNEQKNCYNFEGVKVLERNGCAVEWENKSFFEAVKSIFWHSSSPSGISIAFENAGENVFKFAKNPQSFVVEDLLNEVIKYDSHYQWKEIDGVINVFPGNDYSILDIRIEEFKFEKLSPTELRKKLLETKEFQQYLKTRNLIDKVPDPENKHGFINMSFIGRQNPRNKISIDLKNATVREILNEIVRQKDYGTWTYREFDRIDEGELYHIYRLEI